MEKIRFNGRGVIFRKCKCSNSISVIELDIQKFSNLVLFF